MRKKAKSYCKGLKTFPGLQDQSPFVPGRCGMEGEGAGSGTAVPGTGGDVASKPALHRTGPPSTGSSNIIPAAKDDKWNQALWRKSFQISFT